MDYSTISNKTTFTETEEMTNGELNEHYYLLKKQFESLSNSYESIKQELHDTRRSYQTALDVQSHLNAELEGYQADEEKRKVELNCRITTLQEEISTLREERTETAERHCTEVKRFELEIRRLREEQASKVIRESPERDTAELDEAKAALAAAMSDAMAAKAALEQTQAELVSWRMKTEELVSEMGEMRVSAELRREELRAAGEREAVALADLAEARAMLHQCADTQDVQHAAKGNSIFAEVEDKRQEMAKNLIQMKQTNSRLRRELSNKQSELEALLHEKQTVWQQQAGAAAHCDRELVEAYEERITQLEGACERQRRELARWFGKLCEPAAPGWLPAVVEHLKCECERLRAEVTARGAAQLAGAAQVRDLRRRVAALAARPAGGKVTTPPPTSGLDVAGSVDEQEAPLLKPIRVRPAPDDVRKKVSFN